MKKQEARADVGEKKIKVSTLVYAVLIFFVVLLIVACILAYGTKTEIGERISSTISKIVPFPAAIIDWRRVVFLSDVESNLASVEKFYASQDFAQEGLRIDFTTDEGRKRLKIKKREILDKLVEDKAINILAEKNGITISKKDMDQEVSRKLDEFGTADDVKKDLERSYGWTLEDFKEKVVLPSMYKDELIKIFMSENSDTQQAKEKISEAKKQLEEGKDFVDVARIYSQGQSKEKGGELGWVKKEQMVVELQELLFDKEPLAKNSIIESSIGFHIVEIEDKKKEGDDEVLRLRQIFVPKNTFADWLSEKTKEMNIIVPARGFEWNKTDAIVDFDDPQMRQFEKDAREKTQGDASIMF